jgi:uncharacterized integral membrane protein
MITKFISSAMAIVTLDVYLQSQLHSNDLLFLFASNGLLVNTFMLLLAAAALVVSFKKNFSNWYAYAACMASAIILAIVGVAGGFFSNFDYMFADFLLPLNYLFMLQGGVIFGICALSYKHAAMPANVRQFRTSVLCGFNKLTPSVPKFPHSPTPARGGRIRHA